MSIHLLTAQGAAELARYLVPDTLFAFDLDGTLAPIADDRSGVRIPDAARRALQRLILLGNVLILTGRSRRNALSILKFEPQLVVGNHGAEWPGDESGSRERHFQQCRSWLNQLQDRLGDAAGVDIEDKELSLAVHYGKAEDHERALFLIDAAVKALEPEPRVIGGRYVLNILPRDAMTKGKALLAALETFGCRRAIYFGDDLTDEEVFELEGIELLGVHVGEERTAAPYHLKKQSEMKGVLDAMVKALEKACRRR